MSQFCSSCGRNHYKNQCWGAPREPNYIGNTNRGQWSPYSTTCEQTIQDHVFNDSQHYNRRFFDGPNYYEVPQPPDPTSKLKEMLIECMSWTQNAIQRLETQVEQLLLDRQFQLPESLLDGMVNTCCEEKDFEFCSGKISSEPKNNLDDKEEEICALTKDQFEEAIEPNFDNEGDRKDKEVAEMEEKEHLSIQILDSIDVGAAELKESNVVDAKVESANTIGEEKKKGAKWELGLKKSKTVKTRAKTSEKRRNHTSALAGFGGLIITFSYKLQMA